MEYTIMLYFCVKYYLEKMFEKVA
jgi:hypothetical protein